MSTFSVSCHLI